MHIFSILLFAVLISACTFKSENLSQHYPNHVGGNFYLSEDMELLHAEQRNQTSAKYELVRKSECCHSAMPFAYLPKGTQIQIDEIRRLTMFTNDCNEAIGTASVNGTVVDFEFFINCNYDGFKVAGQLPWQREL